MKRIVFVYVVLAATAAILGAQQGSQPSPYTGTSNPPPDDTISTPAPEPTPEAKPSPSHYTATQQPPAQAQPAQRSLDGSLYTVPASGGPANAGPARKMPANQLDGTDNGIVQVEPDASAAPALNQRPITSDPDGDIVHPAPLPPGTFGRGRRDSSSFDGPAFDRLEREWRSIPYARCFRCDAGRPGSDSGGSRDRRQS